jgi:hypothetical protein
MPDARRFRQRGGDGNVQRWSVAGGAHRCDQPIAQPWHGHDVTGLLRVIAKQPPQGRDCLVHRVLSDHDTGPDLIQQFLDADRLAGPVGEVHQQPHRARLEPHRVRAARHLAELRVDAPVTNLQRDSSESVHGGRGYTTAPGILQCDSVVFSADSGLFSRAPAPCVSRSHTLPRSHPCLDPHLSPRSR